MGSPTRGVPAAPWRTFVTKLLHHRRAEASTRGQLSGATRVTSVSTSQAQTPTGIARVLHPARAFGLRRQFKPRHRHLQHKAIATEANPDGPADDTNYPGPSSNVPRDLAAHFGVHQPRQFLCRVRPGSANLPAESYKQCQELGSAIQRLIHNQAKHEVEPALPSKATLNNEWSLRQLGVLYCTSHAADNGPTARKGTDTSSPA